jgi:hypothetical protein
MSFFYNLNKRLADLSAKQDAAQLAESKQADHVAQSPLTQALNEAKADTIYVQHSNGAPQKVKLTPDMKAAGKIYVQHPSGPQTKVKIPADAKKSVKEEDVAEADYSAKAASAGKDIGKPGKMFSKIAKSAGKEYGSKAAGERVAGAVLKKLRAKESVEENVPNLKGHDTKYGVVVVGHNDGKPVKTFDNEADAKAYADKGIRVGGGLKQGSVRTMVAPKKKTAEGNAFTGAVAKAKADGVQPGEKIKVGGKEYPVREAGMPMTAKQKSFAKLAPPADKITFADRIAGAKKEVDEMLGDVAAEAIKSAVAKKKEPRSKGTAFDPEYMKQQQAKKDAESHSRYDVKDTGYSKRYTRKAVDTDVDAGDEVASDAPKKKGRPKGPEKGPERTTKGAWKHKGTRKEKAEEDLDTDGVMMNTPSNMSSESVDSDEYDREGKSAKCDIKTIVRHAQALHKILGDDDNLPEWVQSKLAKIEGMMTSVDDYMQNQDSDDEEQPIAEKAVSKKQQRFMGMVHAAQKGEKPASKEVAKTAKTMKKKDAEDFAKTKHKGLPEKKKKDESVEETTTAGSVATAPAEKKAKGGYNFGGSVYESLNKKYKQALTEGMNISVNMNTGQDGQPSKNITISADGDDADKLAELLKMAGMGGHGESQSCEACGKTPCGCESIDENSPDWPTSTEKIDADPNLRTYSGGLNGPKSTGQSTTPVLASQLRRQVSMEESAKLESNLFKLYQNYKAQ